MELSICILILSTYSLNLVKAQTGPPKEHVHNHGTPMCNGKPLQITDSHNETMKTCQQKVFGSDFGTRPPNPSGMKKIQCYLVCQLQELDLIDETGKLVEAEIENIIKENLPSEEANAFIVKVKACIKDNGNKIETTEIDCSKIDKISMCVRDGFMEVCKIPFPAEKKP